MGRWVVVLCVGLAACWSAPPPPDPVVRTLTEASLSRQVAGREQRVTLAPDPGSQDAVVLASTLESTRVGELTLRGFLDLRDRDPEAAAALLGAEEARSGWTLTLTGERVDLVIPPSQRARFTGPDLQRLEGMIRDRGVRRDPGSRTRPSR